MGLQPLDMCCVIDLQQRAFIFWLRGGREIGGIARYPEGHVAAVVDVGGGLADGVLVEDAGDAPWGSVGGGRAEDEGAEEESGCEEPAGRAFSRRAERE
eukprot:6382177-Pyramimonas_sp.AAC.1